MHALKSWNDTIAPSRFARDRSAHAIVALARDVSLLWERYIRVPVNAAQVLQELHAPRESRSRLAFHYDAPPAGELKKLETAFEELNEHFFVETDRENNWFDFAEEDVRRAYYRLIAFKLKMLADPEAYLRDPIDRAILRDNFCRTTPAYQLAKKRLTESMEHPHVQEAAARYTADTMVNDQAMQLLKTLVEEEFIPKILNLFSHIPPKIYEEFKKNFLVHIEFTEEPGALLRCITLPEENKIIIQLKKDKPLPRALIRLAAAHELGHAASSVLFDRVLKGTYVSALWTFAGISSPNPFDPKEEAFADILAEVLSDEEDALLYWHRKNIWLPARAVADYHYHVKQESIGKIMALFKEVGLEFAAADEALSVATQYTSLKAQYFFGHFEAEKLKSAFGLKTEELISILLMAGNASYQTISEWLSFRLLRKRLTA